MRELRSWYARYVALHWWTCETSTHCCLRMLSWKRYALPRITCNLALIGEHDVARGCRKHWSTVKLST